MTAAIEMVEDITARTTEEQRRQENNEQLERFNRLAVGRELRMAELKQEINGLLAELGRERKYEIVSAGRAEVHT